MICNGDVYIMSRYIRDFLLLNHAAKGILSSDCEAGAGFEFRSCPLASHAFHAPPRDSNWIGPFQSNVTGLSRYSALSAQRDLKQQAVIVYAPQFIWYQI